MDKLTKGQKNQLKRDIILKREEAIRKHGYSLVEQRLGPKGFTDSYSYSIYKDDVYVTGAYTYRENALLEAERLIEKEAQL